MTWSEEVLEEMRLRHIRKMMSSNSHEPEDEEHGEKLRELYWDEMREK